ncbi:MAG: long-chain fatty acid--CoA ligase [Actinomycetota bacterium]|nr:long-chain fatty acid--CoA ligase [Actinomycetota bacterium]
MEERLWHKSYAPGVPWSVDYEKLTVSEGLARSARDFPDRTALNYMGAKISYRELDELVNRFAHALMDLGIGRGDKVATIMPNIPQMIIVNMAAFRIGAVVVLNNPLYTERELQYQLDDSDARIAVTLTLLVPRIEKIMPQTRVEKVIGCQINTHLPFPKKQLFPYVRKTMYRKITPTDKVLRYEDLIRKYPGDPVEDRGEWEELSTIIYTGGTTGKSKGVMLSHRNISVNVQQFAAWFPDLERGKYSLVGTFPVFHAAGFTACQNFFCWQAWEHCMIPRPEPKAVIEILKRDRPDFLPGVPTIFVGLLADPEFRNMDLSYIKGFFSGAAPLAADTIRDLKELTGATILEVYGQTETAPVATVTPWGGEIKPGTVGIPVPDTDIKIVDLDTGERELPPGEAGEIIISGPQCMMGYYKKPQETSEALRDGWVYTGDIGFFDEDGYLSVVDRKKDMVIAGGYNIYPVEIDNVLFDHPKILEACAVGVPDPYRGETVKAFIVVKEGESLSEEEVIAYCKENLAPYKVPTRVEFVDELPKSVVGKILRRELRDRELERQSQG